MPKKKSKLARHKTIDVATEDIVAEPMNETPRRGLFGRTKLLYAVVAVLALSALLLANKSWVVAGMVNGKPIWRWELNRALTDRFGKQTLEGIVSERVIADAAAKSGVTVTKEEIAAKEADIVKGLGANVNIDDLLKYQGITKADFDNQVKLQLTVQKILGKDVVITETDITNFIATNSATLTATDPAKLREEARQAILDQKVGEKVQTWFTQLKDKAQIFRFL